MDEAPVDPDARLRAQLDAVAQLEASLHPGFLNRVLRKVGPTKPFIAVYRRIGPKLDPWLNRRTGGDINKLYGFPAAVLVTTGARSGQRRQSPIFYVRDGDDFVVVGTNFGTEHHPGWTKNLLVHPDAELEVAGQTIAVRARQLGEAGFRRLWPKFRAIYPGYDTYLERLTDRTPRMFALRPVVGPADDGSAIRFLDEHHFVVGDVHFHAEFPLKHATPGRLAIIKKPDMVPPYEALCRELAPRRIVELGIRRGGSTALLNELARPEKLVAIELVEKPPPALTGYIRAGGHGAAVRPHYGVDQGDRARLAAIVDEELDGAPLDLVVDDASHLYEPTLASFEVLFPRLRPGGLFVIEDWRAGHRMMDRFATAMGDADEQQIEALERAMAGDRPERRRLLSMMIHELVMVRQSDADVVRSVDVGRYWVTVTRGDDELDPASFRLADHYWDHFDVLGDRWQRIIGPD